MSVEDGCRLILERGRLMSALPSGGKMVAVFADEMTVQATIAPYLRQVSIAATNAPAETVISGAASVLEILIQKFIADGVKTKRLEVSHAFHSPLMEPMLSAFEKVVQSVRLQKPSIKLISNLTGAVVSAEIAVPAYWMRHVRETVRFSDSMQTLATNGCRVYLEIGPKPTLVSLGQRTVPESGSVQEGENLWLPTLREGKNDWEIALASVAQLWTAGVAVDWHGFEHGYARRKLYAPTYPFERQRYWVKEGKRARKPSSGTHPLLGLWLQSPLQTRQYSAEVSLQSHAFLNDHRVFGMAVLPGTAYIEAALAAGRQLLGDTPFILEDLNIREALVMMSDQPRALQSVLTPQGEGYLYQLYSQSEGDDAWTLHAEGSVLAVSLPAGEALDLPTIRDVYTNQVSRDEHYAHLASLGLSFGECLHGVQAIWRQEGNALAHIVAPDEIRHELPLYGIHPALLDACLQPLAEALPQAVGTEHVYTPLSFDRIGVLAPLPDEIWSHVTVDIGGKGGVSETYTARVEIYDTHGQPLAVLEGLRLKRTKRDALLRTGKESGAIGCIRWLGIPA